MISPFLGKSLYLGSIEIASPTLSFQPISWYIFSPIFKRSGDLLYLFIKHCGYNKYDIEDYKRFEQ